MWTAGPLAIVALRTGLPYTTTTICLKISFFASKSKLSHRLIVKTIGGNVATYINYYALPIPSQIPHTLYLISFHSVWIQFYVMTRTHVGLRQFTLVHVAKCHSTISWIMSSYFSMTGFKAGDNRHNCAPGGMVYVNKITQLNVGIGPL